MRNLCFESTLKIFTDSYKWLLYKSLHLKKYEVLHIAQTDLIIVSAILSLNMNASNLEAYKGAFTLHHSMISGSNCTI